MINVYTCMIDVYAVMINVYACMSVSHLAVHHIHMTYRILYIDGWRVCMDVCVSLSVCFYSRHKFGCTGIALRAHYDSAAAQGWVGHGSC